MATEVGGFVRVEGDTILSVSSIAIGNKSLIPESTLASASELVKVCTEQLLTDLMTNMKTLSHLSY